MNNKYNASLTIQTDPSLSKEDKEFYKHLYEKANYIFDYLKANDSVVKKLLNFKRDFYQFAMFCPFYKIDFNLKEQCNFMKDIKKSISFDRLNQILDLFHISGNKNQNIGLYTNAENVFVREPSITISFGLISKELNFLLSCLITDLAFQQQESSIAFSKVDKDNWGILPDVFRGIGYIINLKNISYEEMLSNCFESKIECTIGVTKRVFAFYKLNSLNTKELQEHESTILKFCQKMDKQNYLKGTIEENASYHYLNFKFLTKEIRNELYDTIIKTYINE